MSREVCPCEYEELGGLVPSLGPIEGKEKFSKGSSVEEKELEYFLIYLRVKLRTFTSF